ncbi:MAG: HypC/HybG/HupF family hydrogenase formation chaperone [Ignavibacteriales bacterium]
MCLAIPGKIISFIESDSSARLANVSFGGIIRQVSLDFLPEAAIGDYVMVHVGFAISIVDQKEAETTLRIILEAEKGLDKGLR